MMKDVFVKEMTASVLRLRIHLFIKTKTFFRKCISLITENQRRFEITSKHFTRYFHHAELISATVKTELHIIIISNLLEKQTL